MKKLAIRLLIAFAAIVVLAVLAISLFLDSAIKRGIETVGPMVTKVTVKLDSVNLSLLSGSGKVKGFVLGNPEGYKTPSAIQVGSASLALQPGSIFADKVVIRSINVQAPEITFETDLRANNLSKIVANLQSATSGKESAPAKSGSAEAKASKKLQVDDFLISGGKIHVSLTVLGGKSATVALPEIHLTDLGKDGDGITAGELTKKVLQAIEKEAVQAASSSVADLSKGAANLTKDAATNAVGVAEQVTKGIGGLFKKK
jgi:hypothetical protein